MASLHGFCKAHNLSKSTVHRLCQENNFDTSSGLSAQAQTFIKAHYDIEEKSPEVTVVDEPSEGASIDGFGSEVVFNAAAIVGATNGTYEAITALNHVSIVAQQLKAGVEGLKAKATAEYLEMSSAARIAISELDLLNHTVTQARAESGVLEVMKLDRLNEGMDAKAKIDALRGVK
jgi:hypothetical protein